MSQNTTHVFLIGVTRHTAVYIVFVHTLPLYSSVQVHISEVYPYMINYAQAS